MPLRSSRASSVPNLEPFSRSKIDRLVKDPSFLRKTEDDLTGEFSDPSNSSPPSQVPGLIPEYCSRLEGDESYSCWRAYFELKDLEVVSLILSFGNPSS